MGLAMNKLSRASSFVLILTVLGCASAQVAKPAAAAPAAAPAKPATATPAPAKPVEAIKPAEPPRPTVYAPLPGAVPSLRDAYAGVFLVGTAVNPGQVLTND